MPHTLLTDDLVSITRDPDIVNQFANYPAIRDDIGHPEMGPIDFTYAVAQPENWFLFGEHGGFCAFFTGPGVYDVHTMIMPHGRGRWAAYAVRSAIHYASQHGAKMLWTRVPVARPAVAAYARRAGFVPSGITVSFAGDPHDIYQIGGL